MDIAEFFVGEIDSVVDERNRVRIPVKIQGLFGDEETYKKNIVLCPGAENCIYMMTNEQFLYMMHEHKDAQKTGDNNVDIRYYMTAVYSPEIDAQGRFVLSQQLRNHANITKDIVFMRNLDQVEIWDKKSYDNMKSKYSGYDDVLKKLRI
ncbi:MAG: hypothetical protein K5765_08910 [Clostridia bacterium]|nr:hypothetical protein [Clostridia bacterium]